MKRILALLLACLMLLPMLMACDNDQDKTPSSTSGTPGETTAVTTKDPAAPDLPSPEEIGDISGDFTILVAGNYAWNDFQSEGESGTVIDSAIYRRNQYMKDTYNVNIINEDIVKSNSSGGTGDGYKKIYTDYMAGECNYDAAMIGTYDVATLAYNGYLHDLNDTKYIDLTKPYWDQKANQDLSINGKMYYTTGDISAGDNRVTHVVLFNKDMVDAYDLDDPYELVKEGKWTLETFGSMIKSVGGDTNNDGLLNQNDTFGLLCSRDNNLAILAGAGERICTINADGLMELTLYSERVVNLYDKYLDIVYDQTHVFNYQYNYETGANVASSVWNEYRNSMFDNDQAMLYFTMLSAIDYHRDSEVDFGILPYPKYDETQAEYGHYIAAWHAQFLCIPETPGDIDRTSFILEMLAYQGQQLLTPAYYEKTLVGQYTRDEESADMLDIIFATRVYDVGVYYNIGGYKDQLSQIFENRKSVTNIYETYRTSAEAKVQTINNFFKQNTAQ